MWRVHWCYGNQFANAVRSTDLHRFIESEPTSDYKSMLILNEEIHMVAADFLHFIVSKIDHIDPGLLALIHKTVINKMLYCINLNRLDLQSRLLHLLHATILMGTTPIKKNSNPTNSSQNVPMARDGSISTLDGSTSNSQANADANESLFRIIGSSPLFVKTVFDALSVPSNRPILQHWMDFLMLALPFLTNYFRRVLLPVIQCLCDQILRSRACLLEAYSEHGRSLTGSGSPNLTDQDLMIFLTGLERLLTFSLAEARLGEEVDPVHKQEWSDGLRGKPGLVANVLSTEVHPSDSFQDNKVPLRPESLTQAHLISFTDQVAFRYPPSSLCRLETLFSTTLWASFKYSLSFGLSLIEERFQMCRKPRRCLCNLLASVFAQG